MDFIKFIGLLDSKSLFFPRASLFEDGHEGSISQETINTRLRINNEVLESVKVKTAMNESNEDSLRKLLESKAKIKSDRLSLKRNWTYVSCWHMNDHESAAMWKLYANQSIAIQSTSNRLYDCLEKYIVQEPESRRFGVVNYIDYNLDKVPEDGYLSEYFFKRKSFSHEAELRVVIQDIPKIIGEPDKFGGNQVTYLWFKEPVDGKSFEININDLIEEVYVAPTSQEWFVRLLKRVLEKYGFNKEVRKSSLDSNPLY